MKAWPLFVFVMILSGCGPKHEPEPASPGKALLVLPAQNSVCTTGDMVSDSLSGITFSWNTAANTSSYELHITNLLTNVPLAPQITTDTKLMVTLKRATPFSWYIVSKSAGVNATTSSDTWKFYNSGPGTVSYAPFPAEIITPAFDATVTPTAGAIKMTWLGSDVDNGPLTYDIYMGTTTSPSLLKSGVTDIFLDGVAVSSGTTYYWRVVSKNHQGDTSDSGVFQFMVE